MRSGGMDPEKEVVMAKGQMNPGKTNKPKLSTKEKQAKKAAKKAAKGKT